MRFLLNYCRFTMLYRITDVQKLMYRLKHTSAGIEGRRDSLAVAFKISVVDVSEGRHKLRHVRDGYFQHTGGQHSCRT